MPEDFDNRVGIENLDIKDKIKKLVTKFPKNRPKAKDFLNEYGEREMGQRWR